MVLWPDMKEVMMNGVDDSIASYANEELAKNEDDVGRAHGVVVPVTQRAVYSVQQRHCKLRRLPLLP